MGDPDGRPWCSTRTNHQNVHIKGSWKHCVTNTPDIEPKSSAYESASVPSYCRIPFTYKKVKYLACTTVEDPDGKPWCSTKTTPTNMHIEGHWKHCHTDTKQDEYEVPDNERSEEVSDSKVEEKVLVNQVDLVPSYCRIPFIYKKNTYLACTSVDDPDGRPWCSTKTTPTNMHIEGSWKYCHADNIQDEHIITDNQVSNEATVNEIGQGQSDGEVPVKSTVKLPAAALLDFKNLSNIFLSYKGPFLLELIELMEGLEISKNYSDAFNMSYIDRLGYAQAELEILQYQSSIYSEAETQEEEYIEFDVDRTTDTFSSSSGSSSEAALIMRKLQDHSLIAPVEVEQLFDEGSSMEEEEEDNLQYLQKLMYLLMLSLPKDNSEVEQAVLSEEFENILDGRAGKSIFGNLGSRKKECHIWDAAARRWRPNLVCKGGIKPKLNLLKPRRRRRRLKGKLGSLG